MPVPRCAATSPYGGPSGATPPARVGDTLTIWGGEKGSPAYYRGTIDGDTVTGAWVYPGGGGYDSLMERLP